MTNQWTGWVRMAHNLHRPTTTTTTNPTLFHSTPGSKLTFSTKPEHLWCALWCEVKNETWDRASLDSDLYCSTTPFNSSITVSCSRTLYKQNPSYHLLQYFTSLRPWINMCKTHNIPISQGFRQTSVYIYTWWLVMPRNATENDKPCHRNYTFCLGKSWTQVIRKKQTYHP